VSLWASKALTYIWQWMMEEKKSFFLFSVFKINKLLQQAAEI
jgi:hypothetical protein